MNFDTIVNAIKEFFNQPVPIIGITIGSLLAFVLTILSKTTIGKKGLNTLKKAFTDLQKNINLFTEQMNQKEKELNNIYLELKEYYEKQLEIMKSEYYALCDLILCIGENTNNKNIKAKVNEFKEAIDLKCKDYEGYVEKKIYEVEKSAEDYKLELASQYEKTLNVYKEEFEALKLEYQSSIVKENKDVLDEEQDIKEDDVYGEETSE